MLAFALFIIVLFVALQPVLARHKSRCGICDSLIWPDEEIVEVDGEWVHADCADEEGFE